MKLRRETAALHRPKFVPPNEQTHVIVLAVVLLVTGLSSAYRCWVTIGGMLLVIGVILWVLGMGRAVGGRKHYY